MRIRDARPEDYDAFLRLFRELGVADPIPASDVWWHQKGALTRVTEDDDGRIVGYLAREHVGDTLFVRNVVSDPVHRRRGIGRALMLDARRIAGELGVDQWQLNVKEDNEAAISLYRSLGFATLAGGTRVVQLPWARIGASDVAVGEADPADDPRIEAELGILPGLLPARRARGCLVFWVGSEGVAVFDAAFPSAAPLIARTVATGWGLLAAMAARRDPAVDRPVLLAIERSEAVADAVTAAGAEPLFRILGMRGAVST